MAFVLVAYYTKGSVYEKSAMELEAAALKLGIDVRVYGVPDMGGWCENTNYKARFFLDRMLEFPGADIAYTDADSMVHRYPVLFDDPPADVVIRRQDFPWRKEEFLSGTFFMRNNETCRRIVESWINKVRTGRASRNKPESWEQYHLGRAIVESGTDYAQLPHDYIYYDHIEKAEGHVECPYITHKQFSRITCK
jgi:hypothetical protein